MDNTKVRQYWVVEWNDVTFKSVGSFHSLAEARQRVRDLEYGLKETDYEIIRRPKALKHKWNGSYE